MRNGGFQEENYKTAAAAEGVRTRDITSRHPTRKRKLDTNEGKSVKSPPAGGKSTAGGPTATGTKLAGSSTISLIPVPSNTVTLEPANAALYAIYARGLMKQRVASISIF
ncbi:unnamed protein product [Acanthoscelides obtectus]|uniref:Uncharacterized protein n=1 Tax=Acanthoscelides obtectus TaxID=200917 RepID=A0A9P0QAD0_ACAOB|nr:unnamed protein product [Acanthoscelides obtectus]CAK1682222.1 hypothetical protein AOBTE_LOCUS33495 [Acanthoscelides obtectus]